MKKDLQVLASLVWELRFLSMTAQIAHWRVFGPSSYSDHLLLGRIYEKLNDLLDPLAEQLTAISTFSDDTYVCPLQQAKHVERRTQELFPDLEESLQAPDTMAAFMYEHLLSLSRSMRALAEAMRHGGYLSFGLEDLLASTAAEIDKLVFFLERRTMLLSPKAPKNSAPPLPPMMSDLMSGAEIG